MRLTFVVLLVAAVLTHQPSERDGTALEPRSSEAMPAATSLEHPGQGFLYGRVTTFDGSTYAGRLRFGRNEEAFWGDYFNGVKAQNPWAQAAGVLQKRRPITLFGFEIPLGGEPVDYGRPFMARFGDIARIESHGRDVRVTLKSGTAFGIEWGGANDLDDGVRVWDDKRGVIDLFHWAGGLPPASHVRIRTIELLPTVALRDVPGRLHGTVRTAHGDFAGFIQWNRRSGVSTDELAGRTAEGPVRLRFDTIRSIVRLRNSSLVTLLDGREILLSGTRDAGEGNGGMYVDDARYGRVLVSWGAFDRIDFTAGGGGPAYRDFPPGRPLSGTVITRGGQRLAGRLVYDLDESETTETLDAPLLGVDYTIQFALVRSITPHAGVTVTLHSGKALELEQAGDLGPRNGGLLVFVSGSERPEYVQWSEIERIDFDHPVG